MHWIRGLLYLISLSVVWFFLRPAIPFLKELAGDRNNSLIVLPVVVFGPMIIGWVGANLINVLLAKRHMLTGVKRWEDKIVEELAPDSAHPFPVVLVPWPSADVRSLALLTDTYKNSTGQGNLASVYIPGTPHPETGVLRVVPADELIPTDWTFQDLLQFHWSYGSAGAELFAAGREPHDGELVEQRPSVTTTS